MGSELFNATREYWRNTYVLPGEGWRHSQLRKPVDVMNAVEISRTITYQSIVPPLERNTVRCMSRILCIVMCDV